MTKLKNICQFQLFAVIFFSLPGLLSYGQVQKGMDINGEASNDNSGFRVCMADSNTVAISAPYNAGNGTDAGHVRIYAWNGSQFVQKGSDIDGKNAGDNSGFSISMPDADIIAIGSPFNADNGPGAGHVRVFNWDGTSWIQKGNSIEGASSSDWSGWSVSMPDENTVAIGAPNNDNSGVGAGHVRIFSWNGLNWIQKGTDINAESPGDNCGYSVSMPDSNTVAIGAYLNSSNAGHTRIFTWNGVNWIQKGSDIDGEAPADWSGISISMPDPDHVAIGANRNNGNGSSSGHVRIYKWNGNNWTQKGSDIDGEAAGDRSGGSVSMPDSVTVAIGANLNNGNGTLSGHVRIFNWNGNAWLQKGMDIDGEMPGDLSGQSVSMPDPWHVLIGAHSNDGNGPESGHARIYKFNIPTGVAVTDNNKSWQVYPNPVSDKIYINNHNIPEIHQVILRDHLSKEILYLSNKKNWADGIDINISSGLYFLEIVSRDGLRHIFKIIIQ